MSELDLDAIEKMAESCNVHEHVPALVAALREARAALKLQGEPCEVCWTNSWAPMEKEDGCRLKHPHDGDHVFCQMCANADWAVKRNAEMEKLRAEIDDLYERESMAIYTFNKGVKEGRKQAEQDDKWFDEGVEAAMAGKTTSANPYHVMSDGSSFLWDQGFWYWVRVTEDLRERLTKLSERKVSDATFKRLCDAYGSSGNTDAETIASISAVRIERQSADIARKDALGKDILSWMQKNAPDIFWERAKAEGWSK